VVGRNPPAALTRTERRVRFTGQVDDLRPHLAEAAVCVAPLRIGSGTRLKVLEALAHLRPVVSTSVGVEGLRLRHEHDLLIADSAEAFARAAIRLLTNRGEAELLAARGRASVEAHYSPRAIAGAMAAVFDRAAAVRSSRQ
jgi:glycosyltransferase involved in cell wall biosynthesis